MGAGESAAAESERLRRAAARLQRKADHAAFVAENFAKGAAGESLVADALAPLEAAGWRVLHDRAHPDGGNIDHLAVGPPGVAVLDAKNWSSPVTITPDRRLVAGKHDHTAELDRLATTVELVRSLLARDGGHVALRGYLVLTGEVDRSRESTDLGDIRIIGVDHLASRLARTRGDLDPGLIDAIASTLDAAHPPAALRHLPPPPAASATGRASTQQALAVPSALFDRAHRMYYLRRWRKGGHDRLYLSDTTGTSLGWTDVNTGSRSIGCSGVDAKFAEALLAAADPTGMKLAPGDLPKVATQLWGGRLLSKIARLHTAVLVGQEWRSYGKHRLYGTLIDPAVSTFALGYIDLKDRSIHPSVDGPIARDFGPARRYLEYLLLRLPERSGGPST